MEGIELICFQIISTVGNARSLYIEAIQAAKAGDFEKAEELIKEGEASFTEGHAAHGKLIQQEASGEATTMTLLLTHAEDQLMSAEAFGILSREFVDLYKEIKK
ncbi:MULTISPECIES: PTS lactose/cellobiose transporter subunit IIA [Bacillota]|jgi:PTS system cellobiose-specific IIA component|uniref:PTS lactose/cellobiose transporter subunit IIA n=2 Tax=Amedibacillus TaxID=2749846 RepID=A0A7G9GJ67_9FIRM|nr:MULTISPECIES: PTS lactose/cellobiose transporter subunit IIA [Bacillota]QNM10849.1 PTS lactose/cellobiose transporter subunit IIA [[Eubacterium] hominis]MCH4285283.1 PTS lactose/cellobiose transporter subunit IIA [Amedibacillus hominis]RGB58344.1 PTS lactose/cellobiose transporter subunit IIA [Absiella sp. AM22-9]RGB63231.1 PTS lactose/cellobiose transporter subunit IIA [Absiella sp. AM10-20]RGB65101.1 PTS lactose/cellobiose transporter subunit IIA [Absiella sp. AM09-45]